MKQILIVCALVAMAGCRYDRVDLRTGDLSSYLAFLSEISRTSDEESGDEFGFNDSATTFEYHRDYKVVYVDSKVLSFKAEEFSYTGGAHGRTTITVGSFDRKTGKLVKLSDLLSEENREAFTETLRAAVVAKLGGEDRIIDDVRLHDNFYIAQGMLHFVFNEYEVADYAAGAIEVVVPIPD